MCSGSLFKEVPPISFVIYFQPKAKDYLAGNIYRKDSCKFCLFAPGLIQMVSIEHSQPADSFILLSGPLISLANSNVYLCI